METASRLRYARISPQKCRLVVDQIRGLQVDKALEILTFSTKKAAAVVRKVLSSAIANAENNDAADIDELKVSQAFVDQAPPYKRFRPRAKGRSNRILKQCCHITIMVSDGEVS